MSLMYSKELSRGTTLPSFALQGTDGRIWTQDDFSNAMVLVVVFTCNHCPYAKANEDRLIALQNDFSDHNVRFVLINPNDALTYPEDSFENMVRQAEEKAYPFPYLHDETQQIARTFDAACTPDVFVFNSERELVYNGRIDDNWQDPSKVSKQDLRNAIELTLVGRTVSLEDQKPSMGCSIKWK